MTTKRKFLSILLILLCAIGVGAFLCYRNNKKNNNKNNTKQQYLDKTMESVIEIQAKWRGGIENIHVIYLGYTCHFDTILDLEKLPNLEAIHITGSYDFWPEEPQTPVIQESPERVKKIERELAEILDICTTVEYINIMNKEGTCNLDDLSFLTHGKKLEGIGLWSMGSIDYSPIYDCSNLKDLGLYGCDINDLTGIEKLGDLERLTIDGTAVNSAKDIVKLKNLKFLDVGGTPLAENKEELSKIQEKFPDLKILFD